VLGLIADCYFADLADCYFAGFPDCYFEDFAGSGALANLTRHPI